MAKSISLEFDQSKLIGVARISLYAEYTFTPSRTPTICILPPSSIMVAAGTLRTSKVVTLVQPLIGPPATTFIYRVSDGTTDLISDTEDDLIINLNNLTNNGESIKYLTIFVQSQTTVASVLCTSVAISRRFGIDPDDCNRLLPPRVILHWGGNEGISNPWAGDWTFNNFQVGHNLACADSPMSVIADRFDWDITLNGTIVYPGGKVNAPTTVRGTTIIEQRIRDNVGQRHILRIFGEKGGLTDSQITSFPFIPRDQNITNLPPESVSALESAT